MINPIQIISENSKRKSSLKKRTHNRAMGFPKEFDRWDRQIFFLAEQEKNNDFLNMWVSKYDKVRGTKRIKLGKLKKLSTIQAKYPELIKWVNVFKKSKIHSVGFYSIGYVDLVRLSLITLHDKNKKYMWHTYNILGAYMSKHTLKKAGILIEEDVAVLISKPFDESHYISRVNFEEVFLHELGHAFDYLFNITKEEKDGWDAYGYVGKDTWFTKREFRGTGKNELFAQRFSKNPNKVFDEEIQPKIIEVYRKLEEMDKKEGR